MAMKSRPASLYKLSVVQLARAARSMCLDAASPDPNPPITMSTLRSFVKQIPNYAANDYVTELILDFNSLMTTSHTMNSGILAAALHPSCTRFTFDDTKIRSEHFKTVLMQAMAVLSNLVSLNINIWTPNRTGEVFVSISRYCRKLECLSIQWGFLSSQCARMLVKCKMIRTLKLDIDLSFIDDIDALHVLDNLPLLENFTCAVINLGRFSEKLARAGKKYKLKCLVLSTFHYKTSDTCTLDNLFAVFPDLVVVNLPGYLGPLSPLNRLAKLQEIGIRNRRHVSDDIFVQMLAVSQPWLQSCELYGWFSNFSLIFTSSGTNFNKLTKLALFKWKEVDLEAINIFMPNLCELSVRECQMTSEPFHRSTLPLVFTSLKSLEVEGTFVTKQHLRYLLSDAQGIEELWVASDQLDDSLLIELLQLNPMNRLKTMCIQSIALTKSSLPILVEKVKEPKSVELIGNQWTNMFTQEEQKYFYQLTDGQSETNFWFKSSTA